MTSQKAEGTKEESGRVTRSSEWNKKKRGREEVREEGEEEQRLFVEAPLRSITK